MGYYEVRYRTTGGIIKTTSGKDLTSVQTRITGMGGTVLSSKYVSTSRKATSPERMGIETAEKLAPTTIKTYPSEPKKVVVTEPVESKVITPELVSEPQEKKKIPISEPIAKIIGSTQMGKEIIRTSVVEPKPPEPRVEKPYPGETLEQYVTRLHPPRDLTSEDVLKSGLVTYTSREITGGPETEFIFTIEKPTGEITTKKVYGKDFSAYVGELEKTTDVRVLRVESDKEVYFQQPSTKEWETAIKVLSHPYYPTKEELKYFGTTGEQPKLIYRTDAWKWFKENWKGIAISYFALPNIAKRLDVSLHGDYISEGKVDVEEFKKQYWGEEYENYQENLEMWRRGDVGGLVGKYWENPLVSIPATMIPLGAISQALTMSEIGRGTDWSFKFMGKTRYITPVKTFEVGTGAAFTTMFATGLERSYAESGEAGLRTTMLYTGMTLPALISSYNIGRYYYGKQAYDIGAGVSSFVGGLKPRMTKGYWGAIEKIPTQMKHPLQNIKWEYELGVGTLKESKLLYEQQRAVFKSEYPYRLRYGYLTTKEQIARGIRKPSEVLSINLREAEREFTRMILKQKEKTIYLEPSKAKPSPELYIQEKFTKYEWLRPESELPKLEGAIKKPSNIVSKYNIAEDIFMDTGMTFMERVKPKIEQVGLQKFGLSFEKSKGEFFGKTKDFYSGIKERIYLDTKVAFKERLSKVKKQLTTIPAKNKQLEIEYWRESYIKDISKGQVKAKTKLRFYKGVKDLGLPEEGMGVKYPTKTTYGDFLTLIEKEKPVETIKKMDITRYEWYQKPLTEYISTAKKVRGGYGGGYAIAYGFLPVIEPEYYEEPVHKHWKEVAPSIKTKEIRITGKREVPSIKNDLLDKLKFGLNIRNIIGELPKIVEGQLPELGTTILTEPKQIQQPVQKIGLLQGQVTDLTLDVKTPRITIPHRPTPPKPIKIIPPILPEGKTKPVFKERKKPVMEGTSYNVYVKERSMYHGKIRKPTRFVKMNKKPLTESDALALGGNITDNSAAISFIIRKTKGRPERVKELIKSWETIKHKFAKRGEVYIEKNPYRLDTPGEHKGISALGVRTNIMKKMKKDLFNKKGRKKNVKFI